MTDVLIAGAGPTGLLLAAELAIAGVEVTVLDRRDGPGLPRPVGLQPRTAELFELRGLDPAGPEVDGPSGHFAGLPVALDHSVWRTRHPRVLNRTQDDVEAVLAEHAVKHGAVVERGHDVTTVEADDEGVTVDGRRARWLVACDGAHSTVRRLLGVPFPGRTETYVATLAHVRLAAASALVPARAAHFSEVTRQANGYWAMLTPLGDGGHRFVFGSATKQPGRDAPVSDTEVTEALTALYGSETRLGEVYGASRFNDATRQLERYRHGRVLFAGDAAHIHPPLGGQGLNLGVQDAMNLGWKLAATVRGTAPAGLLDTYHAERHPAAARVLRHTAAQRVFTAPDRSENVEALREIVVDLMRTPDGNRYFSGLLSGLGLGYPGAHRVPDLDLTTAAGPARLSELLRDGRGLLLDLGDHPVPAGFTGQVRRVRASTGDDEYRGRLLLVRPDGYAVDPAELGRWFG
ncbi:2-polyprenyl-6-methoxyphenol hydroxylase-like FAD-dependent oxidoreductase [Amycolatopsis lexingtonensis]|uniref:2-polyprenyl-6-methoxyphenol hydroxylase-like FAD-dependent oxidoreductase n=1 Tax=Amycolatopsis lexingtonensis TaxID=218822 RepID=A0ABR9IBG7_9PSEU|nr:FAD-dependent monooxygenase [Amycolatopsis lexingtonensis]MBE1500525.1 2-polyprenyl-6-methoxyphenol hydroxylase-like FAD-dependent oxidoreductase [Amycolatopsis lexingtonensis]